MAENFYIYWWSFYSSNSKVCLEDMIFCFIICFSTWLLSPLTLFVYMQFKKLKEQKGV